MSKAPQPEEPRVEVDDHMHEYIFSHVSPEVEKKHREKSKARAIKMSMKPEVEVAEVLYGDARTGFARALADHYATHLIGSK
jgi:hypothetical protein